jgi:hypothetical protein
VEEEVVACDLDIEELCAEGEERDDKGDQDDEAPNAMDLVGHEVASPVNQLGGQLLRDRRWGRAWRFARKRVGRMGGWGVGVKECLDLKLVLGFTPPILPGPIG